MPRARSERGHGERLREELLDAAEELLAEHDDERQVTIRAIVERVGVTPPSLYRHFGDKRELIEQVVARRFLALGAATMAAAEGPASRGEAAEALRAGCLAYLTWARENPGGYAVLFRVRRDTELGLPAGSSGSVAFDGLRDGIDACQAAGQAHDGDPHLMAAVTWTGLHGIATLTVLREHFPWPDLETMVDALLHGVVGTPRR